jgi:glycosyltransferase involved in cell wall biosynthesis
MITVFTPSFADEANTNAQNLTVKEVVARLSPQQFRVIMFADGPPDGRIAARSNTTLLQWQSHGNTLRTVARFLSRVPDIYFFPREGPLDAALLSVRKHARLATAVATYIVSGGLERGAIRSSMLRNIAQADIVVGNSQCVSQTVERRTGACVSTIYDGVDQRHYYPPATRTGRGKLVVLYAGSFHPWKRAHVVVEHAALWPEVQFRIAGKVTEDQRCRQLAQDLGCRNVTFLGHLSQPQLGKEMRGADIFFFPSELEGHPQVLAQAAASGLPSVAMNYYRPEFVRDGETGFLANSDRELTEGLRLLLTSPDLRTSMSSAAVAHMRRFDWDHIAAQWAGIFDAVAERKRRGRGQD